MKRIIFFFAIVALFFSCDKDDLTKTDIIDDNTEIENRGQKVDVCHNGHIIRVSINAVPAHQAHGDAVDMDGDGYFDKDNVCGPTDCDDNNAELTDNCNVCPECPFGEILSQLNTSEYCYTSREVYPGYFVIEVIEVATGDRIGGIYKRTRRFGKILYVQYSWEGIPKDITDEECYNCAENYITSNFPECE